MAYLLDTNVFIQAKNLHYGLDFCPAFWDWLVEKHNEGEVLSIAMVLDELLAGADELTDWANARGASFFPDTDATVVPSLSKVADWVNTHADYTPAAKSTFLQVADYYLVATAHAKDYTLVTHEVAAPSRKVVKIPNACIAMKVRYASPYQMLRRERARFVLGPSMP